MAEVSREEVLRLLDRGHFDEAAEALDALEGDASPIMSIARARLATSRGDAARALAELARAYEGSEDWIRDVVLRSAPPKSRAGIRDVALVQDAAFAHYALGASDYRP